MRRPFALLYPALAAMLVMGSHPLLAQEWAGRGRVKVEVTAQGGGAIAGAAVSLRLGRDQSVSPPGGKTDKKGRFSMLGLKDGTWIVRVEAEGYHPWEDIVQVFATGSPEITRVFLEPLPVEVVQAQHRFAAQARLDKAREMAAAGDVVGARAEYRAAMEELEESDHPVVLALLATSYLNAGELETAREIYAQALAIDPGHLDSLKGMCALEAAEGDLEAAEALLAKIPETEKIHPTTLMNVAMTHYNNGEMEPAKGFLDRVVRDDPKVAQAYYFRGLVQLSLSDNPGAKADFEKYLELEPEGAQAAEVTEYLSYLNSAP